MSPSDILIFIAAMILLAALLAFGIHEFTRWRKFKTIIKREVDEPAIQHKIPPEWRPESVEPAAPAPAPPKSVTAPPRAKVRKPRAKKQPNRGDT